MQVLPGFSSSAPVRWVAGIWARVGLPLAGLGLLLAGCAPVGPVIDTRYTAVSQDSRAQFLVIHYTQEDFESSVRILAHGGVSAHYLLSDESPPRIYRLVDENRRAYHAGQSRWQGQGPLNAMSIGIEIVHPGVLPGEGPPVFVPYRDDQIDTLIPLVKDIVRRHGIRPDRVVAHSDVAPQRKIDPGPLFPWKRLADHGLVVWPDPQRVAELRPRFEQQLPDAAWFQGALARAGYDVPRHAQWDAATQRVLAAFQMRFRPARYDGQADAESAALLQVLAGGPAP